MHERIAARVVGILRQKKIAEGSPAAELYIKRLCNGAPAETWGILREAQEKAKGWDMGTNT